MESGAAWRSGRLVLSEGNFSVGDNSECDFIHLIDHCLKLFLLIITSPNYFQEFFVVTFNILYL